MKPVYAVFVPVGPNVNRDFVADTIESALHFMGRDTLVVVGNDSGSNEMNSLSECGERVVVKQVEKIKEIGAGPSVLGSLFVKKMVLFGKILEEFQFDRLLSLDDDALVLNDRFLEVAERLFAVRKNAGILGRYTLNHEYQPLAFESQLEQMRTQISRNPFRSPSIVGPLLQPKLRKVVRPLMLEAIDNGYVMGTAFIGGSCVFTRHCLEDILNHPASNARELIHSPSCDDDLLTVFCYAAGHRVYDFFHEPTIFHIGWRKLTMSPEQLHAIGASVIHSVRDPEFGGEAKIRAYFREKRSGSPSA